MYDSRRDRNQNGEVDLRVHTKYMLVSGHYRSDRSSWQVFTGTANWSRGSLAGGDEVMLRVNRKAAYWKYMGHYDYVRTHARRPQDPLAQTGWSNLSRPLLRAAEGVGAAPCR